MVTYPFLSNLSDDEQDDGEEKKVIKNEKNQVEGCTPCVEDEEDWEIEIMLLNNPYPYGPEDLLKGVHLKVPFHVPDHKQSDVKYNPSIHHVPPVRFTQTPKVVVEQLEGDQFEDAEE